MCARESALPMMASAHSSSRASWLGKRSNFLLPLISTAIGGLFRLLPVVLSWPFPIGYDTTATYIIQMIKPLPNFYLIFGQQDLHAVLLSFFFHLYPSAFSVLNFFAVGISAILALEIYAYALTVSKLEPRFAFVTSIVFTFNLLTMRLLWDQYRIDLGLIFVLLVFLCMSSGKKYLGWAAIPLSILVFFSNAEPAVFLVITLAALTIITLFKNYKTNARGGLFRTFRTPLPWTAIVALFLGVAQLLVIRTIPNHGLTSNLVAASIGLSSSINGIVFLIYCAWPFLLLLPFVLRSPKIDYHLIWFFAILLLGIAVPFAGRNLVFEPIIWLYWLMGFPLSIFLGTTLQVYSKVNSSRGLSQKSFISNRQVTYLCGVIVLILVSLSVAYAISSPLAPNPYSVIATRYAGDISLGYLQSTIPISQERDLMSVLNASLHTLSYNSTVYLAAQFYGLGLLVSNPNSIRLNYVGLVDSESNFSSIASLGRGYTVWWTYPTGWYGVYSIPPNFSTVITIGAFSLYKV